MSLPVHVVDRLFARLAATYGAAWDRSLGAAPLTYVKAAWSHELAGFAGDLHALAWALENLPERCPNVIEFRALARKAPTPEAPRLPEPKADPQRVAAELARLRPALAALADAAAGQVDHRAWARAIMARHAAGERLNRFTLDCARVALRMPADGGAYA